MGSSPTLGTNASMVKLVDALDLKSNGHYGHDGSSPSRGTLEKKYIFICILNNHVLYLHR